MESNKPPSMRHFDYFNDRVRPVAAADLAERADLPPAMESQVRASERARRKAALGALTATLLMAASTWFLWSWRDSIAYAFSRPHPPLVLGDVVGMTPADIPHNAYVELEGITEHRGLTQKVARSVWPWREEAWYFRLVGSRGVFIETPADPQRYGPVTSLTVRGRAVDPRYSSRFSRVLADYRERFHAPGQQIARVIEVGVEPGQGKAPFLIVFGLLTAIVATDVWSLWRFARYSRGPSGIMR